MTTGQLEPPLEPDHEPGDLGGTVLRGAGLASTGYVASQVLTLAFFAALARLATPADFGELASATLVVNVGLLFTESGMLAALIHRKDRIVEAASTATVSTTIGGVLLTIGALAVSPLIGLIFHSSHIGEIAAAASGLMLLRSLTIVPEALLQRKFSFLRRVVIEPGGIAIFGTVAVILTATGMGVWGLLLGYYASAVADVLLSWGLLRWRPRLRQASFGMWRELVAYGRWGIASSTLESVEQQAPVVLLGRFSGAAALGQFRYGARMESSAGAVVVHSAAYVLFPAFARITHERDRFKAAALRSLRGMAMLGMPMGMILVPLGVPAAELAFGHEWRSAGFAAMILSGMTTTGIVISFASEILKADGRPDLLTRVRGINLGVALAAMIALTWAGLYGVCAGLTFGTLVGAVAALLYVARQLELHPSALIAEMAPTAAAATAMAAILTALEFGLVQAGSRGTVLGIVLLLAEAALGFLLYVLFLRLFSRAHLDEARDLARRAVPARLTRRFRRGGDDDPAEAERSPR